MGDESKFTEKIWQSWLEPFPAVQMLIKAGLDDRELAVNWLKGRLRVGDIIAGGWHLQMAGDGPIKTKLVIGRYKVSTWKRIATIHWKDDFWVSGDYIHVDDPLDITTSYAPVDHTRDPYSGRFEHDLLRVRFDPEPIFEFCQRTTQSGVETPISTTVPVTKSRGGRPPKAFWDELWASISAQLYHGDLTPRTQADIEKAMLDWAVDNDEELTESTARRAAQPLWQKIKDEVQKGQN